MKIFQNYSISTFSFIKENINFILNTQHKKILTIVSIAIAMIAACYLAMRYLKFGSHIEIDDRSSISKEIETEEVSAKKGNLIDWNSIIEPDHRYQMHFDNFKRLASLSSIDACPYKKIYLVFCQSTCTHLVFAEDANYFADTKQLPCLPNEALLIYIPRDKDKSKQIEMSFPTLQNSLGADYKMISYEEYCQAQRQGYFSSKIMERLFNIKTEDLDHS